MISVVLYGRNDSYGYNLHKRAALSLNCIAEVLDDPDDEILFVDYNTPDDFPTFPEAIQDTLTEKAKARLRILRARPSLHERFKSKTHLLALEPVARNIAVRRSNPANRWILSTNTDMIFVPRRGESLSAIARDLPKGYYGIPRFELPESLWETLDRYDAPGTIKTVGEWGWRFHLNEIVYGAPIIKFDAPGDFQLIDREDLFKIHGFNEEMLLGWHVDSNICKRLFLLYGEVGDLTDRLFGYHCDHTRQVTPAHKRAAAENSISKFFNGVSEPGVPSQAANWGCGDVQIETFPLAAGPAQSYLRSIESAIASPMTAVSQAAYVSDTHDAVSFDPRHVLPFLLDLLASAPKTWNVAWLGVNASMFDLFQAAWPKLQINGNILVLAASSLTGDGVRALPMEELLDAADLFVLDFSSSGESTADYGRATLVKTFCEIVKAEQIRLAERAFSPRRIVAVDAIHNRYEALVRGFIEYARSPFSSRLRHGFVLPASERPVSWLELMTPKLAGERMGQAILARRSIRGHVASGPHLSLLPGAYVLEMDIEPKVPLRLSFFGRGKAKDLSARQRLSGGSAPCMSSSKWKKSGAIAIEIRNGRRVISRMRIGFCDLFWRHLYRMSLSLPPEDFTREHPPSLSVRIWTSGWIGFLVRRLDLIAVEQKCQ